MSNIQRYLAIQELLFRCLRLAAEGKDFGREWESAQQHQSDMLRDLYRVKAEKEAENPQ